MFVIIRYGEIALKGKNRGSFEKTLCENIRRAAVFLKFPVRLIRIRGRIIVDIDAGLQDLCFLSRIFGVVSYSPALCCTLELCEIERTVSELIKGKKIENFRISARRLDKSVKIDSMELNRTIGSLVQRMTSARVNLDHPEYNLGIEIMPKAAYIFDSYFPGACGIPVGCEGRVYSRIDSKRDVLSSLLMMKRGCRVVPVSFLGSLEIPSLINQYDLGFPKKVKQTKAESKNLGRYSYVCGDGFESMRAEARRRADFFPLALYSDEEVHEDLLRFSNILFISESVRAIISPS